MGQIRKWGEFIDDIDQIQIERYLVELCVQVGDGWKRADW